MTDSFPTLLVSRCPRHAGIDWSGASSWLGGAPRLGLTPWPRDEDGEPLHFVAQIDLAEIAAGAGGMRIPATGSLAFFVGRKGAVIYVLEGRGATPTDPPDDTPELARFGGSRDWPHDLEGRSLYPYWPVRLSVLNLPPPPDDPEADDYDERVEAYRTAQVAAVQAQLPRRQYNLSPGLAFAGPPIPDWWQTAIHYAAYLDKALVEVPNLVKREQASLDYALKKLDEAQSKSPGELQKARNYVGLCEKKIAEIHRLTPALRDFAGEIAGLSRGRDPWASMTADELASLASRWARNSEFAAIHFNQGKFALGYLKDQMFKALPVAGTPEFAALPASVRNLLDQKRAARPIWWHSALTFAAALDEANRVGVPQASKSAREQLDADRGRLASLRPSGPLAGLRRLIDGRDKEAAEVAARIAANEAGLAQRRPAEIAFKAFVDETMAWVDGRDSWAQMAEPDIAQLKAALARAGEEFREFARYRVPAGIEDLESSTLRAMTAGPDRAYAALPEPVRDLVNRDYLLPPDVWHQMFGWGVEIQGDSSAMREDGNIMLLQLTYDDLMEWSFGDNGVYQFWISPDALNRQNWSAAKMTFECH